MIENLTINKVQNPDSGLFKRPYADHLISVARLLNTDDVMLVDINLWDAL